MTAFFKQKKDYTRWPSGSLFLGNGYGTNFRHLCLLLLRAVVPGCRLRALQLVCARSGRTAEAAQCPACWLLLSCRSYCSITVRDSRACSTTVQVSVAVVDGASLTFRREDLV